MKEADLTAFKVHVQRFLYAFFRMLEGEADKAGFELQAAVSKQQDFTQPARGAFRRSPRLGIETGRLSRALIPGKPGNVFSVKQEGDSFRIEYGIDEKQIPYARIHESGGFVAHRGKMPFKLFRLAQETGNDNYRIMGASALKKGGVNIKARPYFGPGIQEFLRTTWPEKVDRIEQMIPKLWEVTA